MMNFLSVTDLDAAALDDVLRLAVDLKEHPGDYSTALAGKSIGLFFAKQSLRTWVSCDVGAIQLGAHPLAIRDATAGLGSRETPADVGRVLGRYLDLLAMRVHSHSDLVAIAEHINTPVVNLLSDVEHPCQAVADLQTMAEHVPLAETVVTYIGDGNNVAHSLILGAALCGATVRFVGPPGYEPDPDVVARARRHGTVELFTDLDAALPGSNVIYTDVWTSMGQEKESELRRRHFAAYQVTTDVLDRAPGAIFMHCLPAHRGEEVTDEVMDDRRSVVFDQAENRLHSFKAILLTLLT